MTTTPTPPQSDVEALLDAWPTLDVDEQLARFVPLPRHEAEEVFFALSARDQAALLVGLPHRRSWMRLLAPDDAADLIQELEPEEREATLALLDDPTRLEVMALLAYAEDEAGGLMNPRFARVRADMTVDEAVSYLRKQARERPSSMSYIYALDDQQRLLGALSFRELFAAPPDRRVRDVMTALEDLVTVLEDQDQEQISHQMAEFDLIAVPVVDSEGRMKGVVTLDDIVDVVQEEATEDIAKMAAVSTPEAPYLQTPFLDMIRQRGVWLTVLFLGEMLTASAMAYFEGELHKATVLALFIPLIISSGGNSGSQASTLIIRAMALGEVRLQDWFRVVRRELGLGLVLGTGLGLLGILRVMVWEQVSPGLGAHYVLIGVTVALSLVGVVTFGTTVGSMLPFLLRRLGLDPASASAPFVATLVDVTGLVIYFTAAITLLRGTLL